MPALQRLFQGQGTPSRSSISPPWACRMGQHEGPASAVRNDCGCAGICTLCVPHRRQCRVSRRYGFWHLGHRSPRFTRVQKGKHSCITQYLAHSCGVAFPVSNHLKAKHSKTMQWIPKDSCMQKCQAQETTPNFHKFPRLEAPSSASSFFKMALELGLCEMSLLSSGKDWGREKYCRSCRGFNLSYQWLPVMDVIGSKTGTMLAIKQFMFHVYIGQTVPTDPQIELRLCCCSCFHVVVTTTLALTAAD